MKFRIIEDYYSMFHTKYSTIFIFICLLFIIVTVLPLHVEASNSEKNDNNSESRKVDLFNFVVAGDFGCTEQANRTIQGMIKKEPELVLALGDHAYNKNPNCWLDIISPLASNDKFKISFGSHDVSDGINAYNRYLDYFNLTRPYYSFDYGNVHFLAMATPKNKFIPYNETSEQYAFINSDLREAHKNESIDWIIVYTYRSFYSSNTTHPGLDKLQDTYHRLFDKYDVDVVLQGHNHNYQRTYPISYNHTKQSTPVITDSNDEYYTNIQKGQIFVTVGTGGQELYNFTGKSPYVVKQMMDHGFLNIEIIENGSMMTGTFYANAGGRIMDEFGIKKNISEE